MSVIIENRQAKYDYEIKETFEAGIKLTGAEVKSVKNGGAQLKGSYVMVTENNVPLVVGMHISRYNKDSSSLEYNPTRSRILLLNKNEIDKLRGSLSEKGLTAVPVCLKNVRNLVKLDIGIGISKKKVDKREVEKKRDSDREISRTLKNQYTF